MVRGNAPSLKPVNRAPHRANVDEPDLLSPVRPTTLAAPAPSALALARRREVLPFTEGEQDPEKEIFLRTGLREKPWLGRVAGVTAALALMGAALTTSLGIPGNAKADVPSCAAAPFTASVEIGTGIASFDVGAGNTATFVCISSAAFAGGQGPPITVNGSQANACYFVDGLGTSVVSVFRERPEIRPDCMPFASIKVSNVPVTAATPSPTTTPGTQPPSTTVPVATPTNTPAATATPRPNTPVPAATQAPTQAAPPPVATTRPPAPPATGNGTANTGSGGPNLILFIALGLFAASAAAGGWSILRQRSR